MNPVKHIQKKNVRKKFLKNNEKNKNKKKKPSKLRGHLGKQKTVFHQSSELTQNIQHSKYCTKQLTPPLTPPQKKIKQAAILILAKKN